MHPAPEILFGKAEKSVDKILKIRYNLSCCASDEDNLLQRCLSGLRSTTGNRVYVISVPRVQIPLSAPYVNNTNSKTEFVLFFTRDFFGLIVRIK